MIMNDINDNKLLINAIEDYELYNKSQKKLLIALIELSVNDITVISITSLSKLIGFSRAAIYNALKRLEKDKLVELINEDGEKVSNFKINRIKFNYILETFEKKQEYIKRNS